MTTEPWMTPEQAADLLGLSVETITKAMKGAQKPMVIDYSTARSVDVRVTDHHERTLLLSWLRDGFAPTVPCTEPGCTLPANFIVYRITPETVLRKCNAHAPEAWHHFVRDHVIKCPIWGHEHD